VTLLSACDDGGDYESKPEYFGYWHASAGNDDYVNLYIDSSSYAVYEIMWERSLHTYKGQAVESEKRMKIHGNDYYFDIIEGPHSIDTNQEKHYVYNRDHTLWRPANWKMVLEGMKPDWLHVCGQFEYYKAEY
jgi:hypothetical protein